jgi:enoyl-CoA hydratase
VTVIARERVEKGILRLTLDRPDVHNAIDQRVIDELDAALAEAEKDSELRVLILRGRGRSFSAGHDLSLKPRDEGGLLRPPEAEARWRYEWSDFYGKTMRLKAFPKPTIAEVRGHCLAAGLSLALACDLLFADETAQFGDPVLRMGALGAEALLLPWSVGVRRAKQMVFTGRSIDATTAAAWGLVNDVVPAARLEERVLEVARDIASAPPFAVQLMKRSLDAVSDEMGMQRVLEHHFDLHVLAHVTRESMDIMNSPDRPKKASEFVKWRDAAHEQRGGTDSDERQ